MTACFRMRTTIMKSGAYHLDVVLGAEGDKGALAQDVHGVLLELEL
jgi:hypothetical protein